MVQTGDSFSERLDAYFWEALVGVEPPAVGARCWPRWISAFRWARWATAAACPPGCSPWWGAWSCGRPRADRWAVTSPAGFRRGLMGLCRTGDTADPPAEGKNKTTVEIKWLSHGCRHTLALSPKMVKKACGWIKTNQRSGTLGKSRWPSWVPCP